MDSSPPYSVASSHPSQASQPQGHPAPQQTQPYSMSQAGSVQGSIHSGIKSEYDSNSPGSSYHGGLPAPTSHNGYGPYQPIGSGGTQPSQPPLDAAGRSMPPATMGGTMPVTQQVTHYTHEPASHSMIELGRRYRLDVVQQPKRARMCGFGDKDRRPITPPPCIRLIITDAQTGNEIDVNDIDFGLFVLNVDLWSADGIREVNLVRHSPSSPQSSMVPASYSTPGGLHTPIYPNPLPVPTGHPNIVRDPQFPYHEMQPGQQQPSGPPPYNPYPQQPQVNPYSQHSQPSQAAGPPQPAQDQRPYNQSGQSVSPQEQRQYIPPPQQPAPMQHNSQMPVVTLPQHQQQQSTEYPLRAASPVYNPPSRYPDPPNHHVYYHTGNSVHAIASNTVRPNFDLAPDPRLQTAQPTATGMFTRNLIGSLAASAFRLTDPSDKLGIWFVLQDLSVRTEGNFRLRFSFVNVGVRGKTPNGNPSNQLSIGNTSLNTNTGNGFGSSGNGSVQVNRTKAPILASCFSDIFTVFSAKKFPGVVESTALSKCFATQGIKIPIRKEGGTGGKSNREEYDDD